ncbi:MAG TPA: FecR domain-containing protein, partial [Spirochaetota bacterium]
SVFVGSVNCKMDKLKKNNEGYNVNTPSSVCAVRGTEFDVATGADGKTVLQVTEGTVSLEGMSQSVLVAKNQESAVAIGGEPEPVKIIKRKDWEKWANESSSDVKGKESSIIEGCLAKAQKLDSDIQQLERKGDESREKSIELFKQAQEAKAAGDNDKATKLSGDAERERITYASQTTVAFYQASRIELVKSVADNAYTSAESKESLQENYDLISGIYLKYFNKYIKPIIDAAKVRQEAAEKRKKK